MATLILSEREVTNTLNLERTQFFLRFDYQNTGDYHFRFKIHPQPFDEHHVLFAYNEENFPEPVGVVNQGEDPHEKLYIVALAVSQAYARQHDHKFINQTSRAKQPSKLEQTISPQQKLPWLSLMSCYDDA